MLIKDANENVVTPDEIKDRNLKTQDGEQEEIVNNKVGLLLNVDSTILKLENSEVTVDSVQKQKQAPINLNDLINMNESEQEHIENTEVNSDQQTENAAI